ncbi:MAG: hypothetical protein ABUL69_05570 [Peristeroidobacter soli]
MPLQQTKNLLDAHAQRILSGDAFDAGNSLSASMFVRMGVEESPPHPEAARWQLKHLAGRIDSLQRSNRTVRCLSLACGHLQEAEQSEAILQRNAMIFAVDQDPRNLRVVSKNCAHLDVDPICASPLDLLNGHVRFGHLDLAYAAELFDHLSQAVATALTAKLFSMLDSGGVVIVPSVLTVRSRLEIIELASAVPKSDIASQRYYEDPFGAIGYLELKKAC